MEGSASLELEKGRYSRYPSRAKIPSARILREPLWTSGLMQSLRAGSTRCRVPLEMI